MRDRSIEIMMPPITAIANGCSIWDPVCLRPTWLAASLLLLLTALPQAQYSEQPLPELQVPATRTKVLLELSPFGKT
jgi:hypothetical protein